MATHMLDYNSAEGRWTACGRYYADDQETPRGVVIVAGDKEVSCQTCLGSERLKKERARRHIAEGAVPLATHDAPETAQ